jgi:hypothetical protein
LLKVTGETGECKIIPFQPSVSLPEKVAPLAKIEPQTSKPASGPKFTITPLSIIRELPSEISSVDS